MDLFWENMGLCRIAAQNAWKELIKDPKLSEFVIPDKMPDDYNFKIVIPPSAVARDKYNIDKVAISVSPDAMGNQINHDGVLAGNLPKTLEIALVGTDDKFSYNHPLCNDVLCFDSVESLAENLVEIANYSED